MNNAKLYHEGYKKVKNILSYQKLEDREVSTTKKTNYE